MEKIIILAGGSGSRLWPYSRKKYPKQILKLIDNESLLQKTIRRFGDSINKEQIKIVTNADQAHLIKANIAEIFYDYDQLIIAEPFARNTAPAILLAALQCDKDDTMIVLPSDHIIRNNLDFLAYIREAVIHAQNNHLVTFGIQPNYPETGYGYIESGDLLNQHTFQVRRFVEKPSLELAESYIKSGNFFWNSGIFVWKQSKLIEEFKKYKPQLYDHVRKFIDTSDSRHYYDCDDISIDYALLEKSSDVVMVKADLQWSDMGSWKSVYDIQPKDATKSVINGNAICIDSKNIFIHNTSSDRTVATVGVENITIIDTDDAVIVCDINKTQDVKKVVDQLKANQDEKADLHRTVYRPWGYYKILEDSPCFKVKRLVLYPGQSISLQYHKHRSETWTMVVGTASVIRGEDTIEISVGQSVHIPAGFNHRLLNKSKINIELIEVQTGTYFGEDDIVRLEDQYKRI